MQDTHAASLVRGCTASHTVKALTALDVSATRYSASPPSLDTFFRATFWRKNLADEHGIFCVAS